MVTGTVRNVLANGGFKPRHRRIERVLLAIDDEVIKAAFRGDVSNGSRELFAGLLVEYPKLLFVLCFEAEVPQQELRHRMLVIVGHLRLLSGSAAISFQRASDRHVPTLVIAPDDRHDLLRGLES